MKKVILILIGIISITISSCEWQVNGCVSGDGNEETRTIDLGRDISEIVLQIEAEVIVSQGNSQEITIEGDGNLIDLIEEDSELSGDTWEINIDECSDTDGLKIFATIEDLESLIIQGSGKFKTENDIFEDLNDLQLRIEGSGTMDIKVGSADEVKSEIEGSGNIKIELESADNVESTIRGSGKIECSGLTDELKQSIEGSGELKFFELIAKDVKLSIEGSGKIEVYAENTLDITLEGSGEVCYKGSPELFFDISGSGKVDSCN